MLDIMVKSTKKRMLILNPIADDILTYFLLDMRYRDDKIYKFLILVRVGISMKIKNDLIDSYYQNILVIES